MIIITWQRESSSPQNKKKHTGSFLSLSAPTSSPSSSLARLPNQILLFVFPIARDTNTTSRVKDFRSDLTSLRTKFDHLKKLHSDSILTQNRAELFGRRPYVSSTPENPYSLSENPYGQIKTNSGITRQEGLLREDTFL